MPISTFDAEALLAGIDGALADRVPGASVAVMRGGEVLLLSAHGEADPLDGRVMTVETPLALGSLSKPFIGVMAVKLWEDGLLDLDADVSDVLGYSVRSPSFPDTPVTVRQLLTHTGGIADAQFTWDATYFVAGDSPIPFSKFVEGYFEASSPYYGADAAFTGREPGTEICYANMGAALVGAVVEEVSGRGLPQYARDAVFGPLRMDRTSYLIGDYCDPGELARGCDLVGDSFVSADYGVQGQPESHPELASGVIRSTAGDVARFTSAIARGGELDGARVLRPESVEELVRLQLDASLPDCADGKVVAANQSLLWMHLPFDGEDYVGHYGGIEGFYTVSYFRPSDGLVLSILLNRIDPPAMDGVEVQLLTAFPAP